MDRQPFGDPDRTGFQTEPASRARSEPLRATSIGRPLGRKTKPLQAPSAQTDSATQRRASHVSRITRERPSVCEWTRQRILGPAGPVTGPRPGTVTSHTPARPAATPPQIRPGTRLWPVTRFVRGSSRCNSRSESTTQTWLAPAATSIGFHPFEIVALTPAGAPVDADDGLVEASGPDTAEAGRHRSDEPADQWSNDRGNTTRLRISPSQCVRRRRPRRSP